jgi:diguanylate cyclase (GGDEF)-like protein
MPASSGSWSEHQLAEFLAVVSSCPDEPAAVRAAAEWAAELLEAEVGAVVQDGRVTSQVGFPAGRVPEAELVALVAGKVAVVTLPILGTCAAAVSALEDRPGGHALDAAGGDLVVARVGGAFSGEELSLLRAMGRVLSLTLRQLRAFVQERELRAERERRIGENEQLVQALQEHQRLLEQLFRVQRAIANRAPLQEILDAITSGAAALFGEEMVGLQLFDTEDPAFLVLVSAAGLPDAVVRQAWRVPAGTGIGGAAVRYGRLVHAQDEDSADDALAAFAEAGIRVAMGAPVREHGEIVGSLVVGSRTPGRVYSAAEQETLLSFADHVSLALADAHAVEAVHHAFHDNLTRLPNRALLMDRLRHTLARANREQSTVALLFVDLDRFKQVNDTLGHGVGDALLVETGRRLRAAVRSADTAARIGGDEFVVLLDAGSYEVAEVTEVAERILASLSEPFLIDGREVRATASVGIALSHRGADTAEDLLRHADVAMYRAKKQGPSGYELFEPRMRLVLVERLALETDLQRAMEEQELSLAYQPIMRLRGRQVTAVEALVRWTHPSRGTVSPAQFIPVAEESGLIQPLGRWVLQEACRTAARWQSMTPGDSPLPVSVNLSPRQLQQPTLVAEITDVLATTGLDPACLILEITETLLIEDTENTIAKLRELRRLGVKIALDDFGTGFSSLSYLRELPLDIVKMDKSFVQDIGEDVQAAAFTRAIVRLGNTINLETVAEGIERDAQLAELRGMGCQHGQGYLFTRPLAEPGLLDFLRFKPADLSWRDDDRERSA